MLLFSSDALWNTLVSYSMRSDRKGVTVNPGSHSSRLSAPAGEGGATSRVTAARAEKPSRRMSTAKVLPHHQGAQEVMRGSTLGVWTRQRRAGSRLRARRAGAALSRAERAVEANAVARQRGRWTRRRFQLGGNGGGDDARGQGPAIRGLKNAHDGGHDGSGVFGPAGRDRLCRGLGCACGICLDRTDHLGRRQGSRGRRWLGPRGGERPSGQGQDEPGNRATSETDGDDAHG